MYLLAGDLGGTNTRLLYAQTGANGHNVLATQNYLSGNYSGVCEVIELFLSEFNINTSIDAACIAVAGPVKSGTAQVTNLPWNISEVELSGLLKTLNISLINDFVAVSYGINQLKESDFETIQQGADKPGEKSSTDAAVIGAGTGLGASHLVWQNGQYSPNASEAGHAGFSPETRQQCELLTWLQKDHSHVSLEMLLSGRGLHTIYRFLHEVKGVNEAAEVSLAMQDEDPAKIITEYAILESDLLCLNTLNLFVEIYGSAASNIALHYYPIGTVYIAGGIAVKIKHQLNSQRFIQAFINKGLMSENLKDLTIKLILNDRVGVYGAVSHAIRKFGI